MMLMIFQSILWFAAIAGFYLGIKHKKLLILFAVLLVTATARWAAYLYLMPSERDATWYLQSATWAAVAVPVAGCLIAAYAAGAAFDKLSNRDQTQ